MSGSEGERPSVSAVVFALLLSSGCELGNNVQGLAEELGNPEPQYVETPGHLIAAGQFESVRFDGNSSDGPFVVGLHEGTSLSLMSFPDGKTCDAGAAANSWRSFARKDAALDARIPVLTAKTDAAPAELRFVNFACETDKLTVAHAEQPLNLRFADEDGFLVQTDLKEILLVDPWRGKQRVVARDAAVVQRGARAIFEDGADGEQRMWTIEAGEVVARDKAFEEVFRAGHDIERLDYIRAGNKSRLLLTDSEQTLLVAKVDAPDSLQSIAKGACEPRLRDGQNGVELFYYAPCDSRELHVTELDSGTSREIRAGIEDFKVVGESETGPALLYVTNGTTDGDSTLWARWGQNEPIRLGDKGHLGLSRVTSKQEARIVVDWDGKGGTLLVGPLGEKLEQRAEGVAYHSSAGIISNFDGENGTLRRFDEEHALEVVAKGVATKGVRNDGARDRTLVLMDYDSEKKEGRLVLIEGDTKRTLTDHVRPDYYRFSNLTERVMVLSNYDAETKASTLELPSTEYDEATVVGRGVGDFIEVDWPRSGVLYTIIDGKEPGIYFAKYY